MKLAISILVVALLVPAAAIASDAWSDFPDGRFYHDAIAWAKANGMTTGRNGGTGFCPDDPVTRGGNITLAKRYDDFDARLGSGASAVTQMGFEVRMNFESSMTIDENAPLTLSLRRCETDDTNPNTGNQSRATLQMRAFSTAPYMTTHQDAADLYPANGGVIIERALGSSTADTPAQTSFVTRDSGAGVVTAEDGRQIAFDGEGIPVAFNVNGDDCYALGIVTMLPPRDE